MTVETNPPSLSWYSPGNFGLKGRIPGAELPLESGVIRFAVADERGEGVAAVDLAAVDARRAFATACQRALRVENDGVTIGDVRFDISS
jgi:hypothetical protein